MIKQVITRRDNMHPASRSGSTSVRRQICSPHSSSGLGAVYLAGLGAVYLAGLGAVYLAGLGAVYLAGLGAACLAGLGGTD